MSSSQLFRPAERGDDVLSPEPGSDRAQPLSWWRMEVIPASRGRRRDADRTAARTARADRTAVLSVGDGGHPRHSGAVTKRCRIWPVTRVCWLSDGPAGTEEVLSAEWDEGTVERTLHIEHTDPVKLARQGLAV